MGLSVLKEMGHAGTMFLRNLVTPLSGHSSEDAKHMDSYLNFFSRINRSISMETFLPKSSSYHLETKRTPNAALPWCCIPETYN